MIVQSILGVLFAAVNFPYWWWVVTRGDLRVRAWVEKRFDVVITTRPKGQWRASGQGGWLRLTGIELIQLAYFMAAFQVWAIALLLMIGVMQLFG